MRDTTWIDQDALGCLKACRHGSRDPDALRKAISIMVACALSGECAEPDRHAKELALYERRLENPTMEDE